MLLLLLLATDSLGFLVRASGATTTGIQPPLGCKQLKNRVNSDLFPSAIFNEKFMKNSAEQKIKAMKRILTAFKFRRARHFVKGEECGITFTMEWNFQAIKQKLNWPSYFRK